MGSSRVYLVAVGDAVDSAFLCEASARTRCEDLGRASARVLSSVLYLDDDDDEAEPRDRPSLWNEILTGL